MTRRLLLVAFALSLVIGCGDEAAPQKEANSAGPKRPSRSAPIDGGVHDGQSPSGTSLPVDAGAPIDPFACTLDTRTVYLQDGKKIESITARGSYWSRTLDPDGTATEGVGFPRSLLDEPKMASGPCAGQDVCLLDARTVYFDGTKKVESIFAYGRYFNWGFDANGAVVPNAAYPQLIEETAALANGPCAGQASGACLIDTRSLYFEGGVKIESMTAQGRFWEHRIGVDGTRSPTGAHGRVLEEIPRLANGPCKGRAGGACTLDTRAVYIDFDGTKTEEITAYGRYWAYRLAPDGTVLDVVADAIRLETIPRFVGPCAG